MVHGCDHGWRRVSTDSGSSRALPRAKCGTNISNQPGSNPEMAAGDLSRSLAIQSCQLSLEKIQEKLPGTGFSGLNGGGTVWLRPPAARSLSLPVRAALPHAATELLVSAVIIYRIHHSNNLPKSEPMGEMKLLLMVDLSERKY